MARNSQGRTWAPTAAGQVVLYGIKSRFDERGNDRGMLVLMNYTTMYRDLFYGTDKRPPLSSKVRIADADAKGGARLIPRIAEENRGTWDVEDTEDPKEKTIILKLKDGSEFSRFTLLPQFEMEKRLPRDKPFDPMD